MIKRKFIINWRN